MSVTIGRRGNRIALINHDNGKAVGFDWDGAIAIGRAIAYKGRKVRPAEVERFGVLTVRRSEEDNAVLIESGGQLLFLFPCRVAIDIGHSIVAKGHELEAEAVAEDLSFDAALLQRRGIALGMTDNPAIKRMQGVKAAHDPTLRKFVNSGALLQFQTGSPVVSGGKHYGRTQAA